MPVAIVHVIVWREGILTRGQIDARVLVINTWVPYGLGFIYYLEVMEVLLLERGFLAKLPTWPWQPGTLASFLTAILLPLVVWAVQAMLQRVLGL